MPSEKTPMVEWIFDRLWDAGTGQLTREVVTMSDVVDAIRHYNEINRTKVSDRNPANFFKDLSRGKGASKKWPSKLTEMRIGADQHTGGQDVFKFVPFRSDQTEAFPDSFAPDSKTVEFLVQSVTIPTAARALGRSDEAWLIQTAINLRVIESHFAFSSPWNVIQINHLQTQVKLRKTEIDALFLAVIAGPEGEQHAIVTCEAKRAHERILEPQIAQQVRAAFQTTTADLVIPIALKALKDIGYFLVEFQAVRRSELDEFVELAVCRQALYRLVPKVRGI